jgi:hypothetical protein
MVLVSAVAVNADRSTFRDTMLLDSTEAEGLLRSKQMNQQQIASQKASLVGTKVLNHLKSIRINKDAHAPEALKTAVHKPEIDPATNALLSSKVHPFIKSAAPRDAKLAEDPNPLLDGMQV